MKLKKNNLLFIKSPICKLLTTCFFLFSIHILSAQIVVNSLPELLPYLDDSNVNVKLNPGTYTITENDIDNDIYGTETNVAGRLHMALLRFSGNNSTYDFTGVTINVETAVLSAFGGGFKVNEVHIIGNNNVLKNLTLVDDGSVNDAPASTAQSVVMDGENNRIEGFHVTVKGSFPYGYGDIFGKGGGSVIGHRKHSACLIRGNSNHLKNSTFIHRSYGHGIFFQGANDPIVEGCYVEGELRKVSDVLAEEGTGSPADNVDFQTVWGYDLRDLPHDYSFSLQEDGIRSYNGGETIINGESIERTVTNATVIGCTVVNMRSGVTIGLGKGDQYVEDCTALACESGFWVNNNTTIVNSRGDASVGPLYSEDASRSNVTAELTLLDHHVEKVGPTPALYLAGSNHDIILHDGTTGNNNGLTIMVGGTRLAHRWLAGSERDANDITLINNTNFPIELGGNSSDSSVTSCGDVTDNGSDNTVTLNDCFSGISSCEIKDAFSKIEAEDFCTESDVDINNSDNYIENIHNGDWIQYENIDFGSGVNTIYVSASSQKDGGILEIRQGSSFGTLLGSLVIENTDGWGDYETFVTSFEAITGEQEDIYFVFKGNSGFLFNVDWIQFSNENISPTPEPVTGIVVSPKEFSLEIGAMYQLTVEISPANADNQNVIWSSDNQAVVTVSNTGMLTAIGTGIAVITATTEDGQKTDASTITVLAPDDPIVEVIRIEINLEEFSLETGETQELTTEIIPLNATNQGVVWSSSNETIAAVNASGIVTAIGAGIAVITATTEDGQKTDTSTITVLASDDPIVEVVGILVSPKEVSLVIGETQELTAEISPVNASNQNFTWSSDNKAIVEVDEMGVVTAIKQGVARVTATTENGEFSDESMVTVTLPVPEIQMYPNPIYEVLRITKAQGASVEIYTLGGALMHSKIIDSNDYSLEMSSLANATYIVRVTNLETEVIQKFIKN